MCVGSAAPQDLQDLVARCLQKEAADRQPAPKLLKHPFFKVTPAELCQLAVRLPLSDT